LCSPAIIDLWAINVKDAEMGENVACTGKEAYRILVGNLAGKGLGVDEIVLIK
jgi:hypothetical protein